MTEQPAVRLNFFKLNVPKMEQALAFWTEAFGFAVAETFATDEFLEHILEMPGDPAGLKLLLVAFKDGRDISVGKGHGPIGFVCKDIEAGYTRALHAGAKKITDIFETHGVLVAIMQSPQGHEIELIQFP